MKKHKIAKLTITALLCGIVLLLVSLVYGTAPKVNALNQDIVTKSEMYAVYKCYKENHMRTPIDSWEWENKGASVLATTGTNVTLLTTTTGTTNATSCSDLFSKNLSAKVPAKNASSSELETFMKKMGYTTEKTGDGGVCATYNFAGSESGSFTLCAPAAATEDPYTMGESTLKVTENTSPVFIQIGKYLGHPTITVRCGKTATSKICGEIYTSSTGSFSDIAQDVFNKIGTYVNDNSPGWYLSGSAANVALAGSANTFTLSNSDQGAVSAINYLFGKNLTSEVQIQPTISLGLAEQKPALQEALNNYFHIALFGGSESSACNLSGTAKSNAEAQGYIELKTGTNKTCFVTATTHSNDKIPLFNISTKMPDGSLLSFSEVVQASSNYVSGAESVGENPSLELTPTDPGTQPTDPGDGSSGDDTVDAGEAGTIAACYQGAGVLSWIVCPVLEAVGSATNWMYANMIEPFLEVRASALFNGEDSLYTGWSTFRDFSNIMFAIAFAIIVLAQVTGIGISNYNIKKILPRFIMVVVLVNISYILCQLAVDISNIVGSNIKGLFDGFPVPGTKNTFADIGASLLNGLGLAVGAGAITVFTLSTAVASAGLAYVMIPILLTFLSCLLAVIFFFVILSARQVGIVILVVLSPIAIICYALPNTKSIFDKWKKLFMALILVYPICGLVMGGGNYVSALLMGMVETKNAVDVVGIFFTITAMLASVLPFFLIPSILKSSMAMAGNLGMKISQFGRGFNNGLQRNIRNSRAFQEHQQQALRNYNMARNGRIMKRSELQDSEKRRLAELRNKGKLTAGERQEMQRLTNKEFRYVRAASARENALREEQKNTVIANRGVYDYGTQRYRSAQEGYNDEQRAKDVAEQTALYKAGQVASYNSTTDREDGPAIDVDSIDSLRAEHNHLLDVVQKDTEGTNQIARARLETVQNLLAAKQDKGLEAMYQNYVDMSSNDKYTNTDLQSVGLKNAVRHLRDNYSGVIKKGNRGFDSLLGSYQNNEGKSVHTKAVNNSLRSMLENKHVDMSSLAPNATINADSDIVKNAISSGVFTQDEINSTVENALADELAVGALSKYTAANLNDLHDKTLERYVDMAERGRLDSNQLTQFSKIVNEGIASGTINLKGEVGKSINQFLQAAYSTGAVARTSANARTATAGSTAMQHASLESLQQISSGLQTGAISGPAATKIVENARRYMESGALIEPERAQELRQIINVAKAQGVNSLAGPTDRFDYDETSFKVRGAPEKIQEVAYPHNMERTTRVIHGPQRRTEVIWQDRTTGRQITDQALIEQAEEAYRINQKVREQNHINGVS